jgi:tRNA dimethylallyltransferase
MMTIAIGKDKRTIVIVCGPTASGKSDLALQLAKNHDGEIICADAMQLYKDLPLLSAAPSEAEYKAVPHHLFQILNPDEKMNAFQYLLKANEAIKDCFSRGKIPILVGGTGLYLKAVMEGISPIPEVSSTIRERLSQLFDAEGSESFFMRVKIIDPVSAENIDRHDRQRLIRALEVYEATGKPLSDWQALPLEHRLSDVTFQVIVTDMPRDILYDRCNKRLVQMIKAGALIELEALLSQGVSEKAPVFRILGAPEFIAHLNGEMSFELALDKAQQATRNYAKRQITWFKHQINKEDCFRLDSSNI